MPRKLRSPKARRGTAIDVSDALFLYLIWGDWSAAVRQAHRDGSNPWALFDGGGRHEAAWAAIVDDAVGEWTTVYPGTMPRSWWHWSAPELRRLIGGAYRTIQGAGRCHDTGVPFIDDWRDDPPLVEREPAYLDRLGLWLPCERVRVPPDAFTAQPFSYTLTVRPEVRPLDDDDVDADRAS